MRIFPYSLYEETALFSRALDRNRSAVGAGDPESAGDGDVVFLRRIRFVREASCGLSIGECSILWLAPKDSRSGVCSNTVRFAILPDIGIKAAGNLIVCCIGEHVFGCVVGDAPRGFIGGHLRIGGTAARAEGALEGGAVELEVGFFLMGYLEEVEAIFLILPRLALNSISSPCVISASALICCIMALYSAGSLTCSSAICASSLPPKCEKNPKPSGSPSSSSYSEPKSWFSLISLSTCSVSL